MAIKIPLESGGSPYGITTIIEFVNGCAKRAFLNAQEESGFSLPTLTGTLVHALLDRFYSSGYFETADVVWKPNFDLYAIPFFGQAEMKAFRTFRAYRLQFDEKSFGKVLGTEIPLEVNDPSIVGCAPYSCRIDMAVKLLKRDCTRILKARNVELEPGIYLVDHKTAGGVYQNTYESHALSPQAVAYTKAYEHVMKKRVKGFLFNHMTTAREPKFQLIPAQNPKRKLAHQRLFNVTQAPVMEAWPDMSAGRANVSRCFDWGQVCHHWVMGNCTGV